MASEYQLSLLELEQVQQSLSETLVNQLIQEVLDALTEISRPIFKSLTQLDVRYLAFRMQQMAVLSEGLMSLQYVQQHARELIVSREINAIFNDLKIAILEIGQEYKSMAAAEELNEKIEALHQKSWAQYEKTMRLGKQEMLRKQATLKTLQDSLRQAMAELPISLSDTVRAGKAALGLSSGVSLPLTQVVAQLELDQHVLEEC
ncbi:MAG: hypothetical protein EBX40_04470 [Gammaproteobacteria bacterium]|nr:hypothetical protein [Gammaproteobacteria bacterium]